MSQGQRFLIEERFDVAGRGTVVVIADTTELPVGEALRATIIRPDSSILTAEAFKEWLLRSHPRPIEKEAYLLRGINKADIPDGSFVEVET